MKSVNFSIYLLAFSWEILSVLIKEFGGFLNAELQNFIGNVRRPHHSRAHEGFEPVLGLIVLILDFFALFVIVHVPPF